MGKKRNGGDDDEDLHPLPLSNADLIQEILVRLPVKCLGQFKSVCKSWITLIESSSFIHLHTTFNSSINNFGSFILLASVDKPSPKTLEISTQHSLISLSSPESLLLLSSSESFASSGSGWQWWRSSAGPDDDVHCEDQVFKVVVDNNYNDQQLLHQLVLKLDRLGVPDSRDYIFKQIVGSCNGLVCLCDEDDNKKVCLWNPATKKHRILPSPMDGGVDWPHHLVAFGFDVETEDYKVVLLTGFKQEFYRSVSPMECFCRVQVYSLSTDSWRLVEGITCLPGNPFRYPNEVLYLNGTCFFLSHFFRTKHHQLCTPENDRFIISFDFAKEIIIPIQLPDHHRDQELYLSCLGDKKIALFAVKYQPRHRPYPPTGFSDEYSIWALLNEHGGSSSSSSSSVNRDSWEKLHSFQISVERRGERNIPRGISNDGKFVLLEIKDSTGFRKRMKLYHIVSNEVKKNFLFCGPVASKAYAYKPNPLVSIKGGNGSAY